MKVLATDRFWRKAAGHAHFHSRRQNGHASPEGSGLSLTRGRHAAANHRANTNPAPFTIATRVVRSACASRVGRTTAANSLDGKVQTTWHPRSLRIRFTGGDP